MSSSSFSLPSASGVVSLLNDTDTSTSGSGSATRTSSGPASRNSAMQVLPSLYNSSSSSDLSSGRLSTTNEGSLSTSPPSSIHYDSTGNNRDSSAEILSDFKDPKVANPGFNAGMHNDEDGRSGSSNSRSNGRLRTTSDQSHQQHLAVPTQAEAASVLGDRIASSPRPIGDQNGTIKSTETNVPMNMHRASMHKNSPRDDMDVDENGESSAAADGHEGTSTKPPSFVSNGGYHGSNVNSSTSPSSSSSSATGNSTPVNKSKGKKRYPCAYDGCDKTFSTSGHAARHHRIHTGQKPFHCTFPGCKAVFSRQDNSLQHYRTHVCQPKSRTTSESTPESVARMTSDQRRQQQVQASSNQQRFDEKIGSVSTNRDKSIAAGNEVDDESVQIGREALENGTAIAVVQEFIDEDGRPHEVVQRMVGVPKGSQRSSGSSFPRPQGAQRQQQQQEPALARTGTHAYEKESLRDPVGENFEGHQQTSAPYQSNRSYGSRQHEQREQGRHNQPPHSPGPMQQSGSYIPAPVSASHGTSVMQTTSYPAPVYFGSNAGGSGSSGGSISGSMAQRHHPYAQMQPSATPSISSSSSSSLSSSMSSSKGGWDDGKSPYDRNGSRSTSTQPFPNLWQDYNRINLSSRDGQSPSPSPSTSSYHPPSELQYGVERLSDTHERKRYMSSHADTPGDPHLSRPSLARFVSNANGSTWPPVSPMASLQDQRKNQFGPAATDDSLRSHTYTRPSGISPSNPPRFSSVNQSSPSQTMTSATPIGKSGFRERRGPGSSMRLEGPLPSISQLPCSSDRSTSTMTPTTPLEGFAIHTSSERFSDFARDNACISKDEAAVKLPPLRNA